MTYLQIVNLLLLRGLYRSQTKQTAVTLLLLFLKILILKFACETSKDVSFLNQQCLDGTFDTVNALMLFRESRHLEL